MPEWRVCGVDEAGRGPIAGPVHAAAVILDPTRPIDGLADSKLLTAARREEIAGVIRAQALAWAIGTASIEEIDALNILRATLLAMQRAVSGLERAPDEALIDGNCCPVLACPARAIVGGDRVQPSISAASILAKTSRDAEMLRLHALYPDYGLDQHKGYPTRAHLERLARHGPSAIHRRSFAPVRRLLDAARRMG